MSKVQTLRVFGKQRLTAAAEEIFELFERTIAEYEEELCRQRKLLDAVLQPQVQLHRTDVQQLLGSKEAVPLEQSSLDQEDPPELPHIKEEQEELWTRQEGEQLPGLEEADITKFTFGAEQTVNPAHIRVSRQFLTECFWRKSLCESVKMSKVQTLRVFGKQKLTAAAEEIFELFERTIAEYEEELCRQRKLLDAVLQPRVHLYRAVQTFTSVPVKSEEDDEEDPQSSQLHHIKPKEIRDVECLKTEADGEDCGGAEPVQDSDPDRHLQPKEIDGPRQFKTEVQFNRADVQQLLVIKEEVEWSSRLDQQDPSELPHIKEEQEELWTRQEGEQLPGLEEADIKVTFTPVPVKSEGDDEEEPQSSQLHHIKTEQIRDVEHLKTEAEGEFCGGPEPEPVKDSDPDSYLQAADDDKTSHSSEPETDDSWDWEDTREPRAGLKRLQNNEEPVGDVKCNVGGKPFSCTICGKRYPRRNSLNDHMKLHSEGKRFGCSVCKKTFQWRAGLERHMRIHTGEKPFSCCFCGLEFAQNSSLISHLRVHTGEKPFKCSICKAQFRVSCNLSKHMRSHSGDKPFSCSVCGKRFAQRETLRRHSSVHTGEKPFTCSVCGKTFARPENLRRHSTVHTGERPFSCSVCEKRFTQLAVMQKHKCVGESSQNK
uniref:Zinc finger protein 2-like n=1 Tax=Sparus aurata TaxID=8175 RepID=A0A671X319_SPAAU